MKNFPGPGADEGSQSIQATRLPRSAFDMSFSHTTTLPEPGFIYPLYVEEVMPGDSLTCRPSVVFRATTPLRPFMTAIRMDWQFFYIPYRLVSDEFTRMMGERINPDDHIDYIAPYVDVFNDPATEIGTLWDYLGHPMNGGTKRVNAYASRSYNLIWNEWFRDEALQDQVVVDKGPGEDTAGDYVLLKRGKRKSYIWGALPYAQKGDPVLLPLGTTAPVVSTGAQVEFGTVTDGSQPMQSVTSAVTIQRETGTWSTTEAAIFGDESGLETDLSMAASASINTMRQAIATQHLLERDARGGTRYRELVLSHFGVQTDDIRLMRPRFLASGSSEMEATQVANTTANQSSTFDVGFLAAFAHAQTVGRSFRETFTEHGLVMGLFSIRTPVTHQQFLSRRNSRSTRYDFYWPDFAALGEQAILSQEIFCDGTGDEATGTGDFSVWGYTPRYEEYRSRESMVTGEFRSQAPASLDIWHPALDFATRPLLNATYIQENPPIDRMLTVDHTNAPNFIVDLHFKATMVRPMPKFAVPGLLRF